MENLINNIVTLDNDEKYIVINQALYHEKNYFLVAALEDNGEDVKDEFKLLEEVDIDGKKALQLVTDKMIIDLLTKYFMPKE